MARLFEKNIKALKKEIKETEAMVLKYNKQSLTEEDINHYAKVFGFKAKARRSAVMNTLLKRSDYWQWIGFYIGVFRPKMMIELFYYYTLFN